MSVFSENNNRNLLMKQKYLQATEIIDWQHSDILSLAAKLSADKNDTEAIAKNCFEWVRDNIYHSSDYHLNPITCKASEVLKYKTGYCYAKSHLLAALLRANSIPAGLCYQRLSVFDNGAPYCLHGLNAVYLPKHNWYRLDPRGNKPGVNTRFTPPQENLAFKINFPEEIDCKYIFSEPLPEVVKTLQTYKTWDEVLSNLPDLKRASLIKLEAASNF
ncbi:transglutaminase family protein [Myxosarcina sp. GI1]|uniref:transglutaminase-like domain-containing protein n=1 Tax=Myxosarcina sp. GI1 TaxID=1541065 RepID=UPI00209DCA59|nr:transglutaminase family protein [Myxosarcina sp. GI1]